MDGAVARGRTEWYDLREHLKGPSAMDFSVVLVVVACSMGAFFAARAFEPQERRLIIASFGAHVVATFVHWGLYEFFWKGGDMYLYQDNGVQLARLMALDPAEFVPAVARLALQRDVYLPIEVVGAGSSTGTMSALAGFIVLLVGPSLLSNCMLTSFVAWLGQLCLYRAARDEVEPRDRRVAAIGILLTPSVVFWGAGFVKEAFVLALLGPMVLSLTRLVKRPGLTSLALLLASAFGVAKFKSYTLVAFALAAAGYFYADRAWRGATLRVRPASLVLAGALAVGGVIGAGAISPEYATDKIAEHLAVRQEFAEKGGSDIDVGNDEARTLPQQLAFAPIALVNSLFRPLIVEVRNGPMVMAGVESTFIIVTILSLFRSGARARVVETVRRTPLLVFSVVFVAVFSVGVGLATANLGTLSRYRTPMMPFFVMTLLVLRSRARAPSRVPLRNIARARPLAS